MSEMDILPEFPEITDRSVLQGREEGMNRRITDVQEVICGSVVRSIDTSIVTRVLVLSKSSLTGLVVRDRKRLAIGIGCDGTDFDSSATCEESK